MNWGQKEKVIREKRTIEATHKNLMGISGKLGVIAQVLGHSIVRQGSGLNDSTYLDDPYEDFADSERASVVSDQEGPEIWRDEIKDMGEDFSQEEGYVFDGLSRGMHLEIKFWHHNQKLEVSYKGYEVYKETAGELQAYVPLDEWEDLIKRLYKAAKQQAQKLQREGEAEVSRDIQEKKETFWRRLRDRWGV